MGVNPTFGGEDARPVRIEVHLLRFDADIYGRVLRLVFRRHLRDERRFDTVEALVAQMAHDVREADALT